MASSNLFMKFVPYGKRYHIYFIHGSSTREREWTDDLIKGIQNRGYYGGCNCSDFDPNSTEFENLCLKCEQSVIIAFVISKESTHSKQSNRMVEIVFKHSMNEDEDKPIIPILLDDCPPPKCLLHLSPLLAFDCKVRWWRTLLKVLEIEIPSSSSGESDEELYKIHDLLNNTLMRKGMRKQKKFRTLCIKSGIANVMSQIGTRATQMTFLKGCGVEIVEKKLVLEWDTFVNVMRRNPDTLNEIIHFNQDCMLSEITLNFTPEGRDEFCRDYPRGRSELVQFLEHSLNFELNRGEYDRITYNVRFRGHVDYAVLHLANNLVRNIYLQNFVRRSSEFDEVEERIKTFENSPYSDESIVNLACAGFIYSGTSNTATCYSCNQSLYGKLELSEKDLVLQHIEWNSNCEHLRKNYSFSEIKESASDPYQPPSHFSSSERGRYNLLFTDFKFQIDRERLANSGFIIYSIDDSDMHVVCTACNYHEFINTNLDELEKNHLLCSGEHCPILVKKVGLQAIKKFRKEHEPRIQHRLSITLQTIMMRKSLHSF